MVLGGSAAGDEAGEEAGPVVTIWFRSLGCLALFVAVFALVLGLGFLGLILLAADLAL